MELLVSFHVLLPVHCLPAPVGLAAAANAEADATFRSKIAAAQVMTVIRWSTYPLLLLVELVESWMFVSKEVWLFGSFHVA